MAIVYDDVNGMLIHLNVKLNDGKGLINESKSMCIMMGYCSLKVHVKNVQYM